MQELEIQQLASISTIHVSRQTRELLDVETQQPTDPQYVAYDKDGYGYILFLDPCAKPDGKTPADLQAVLDYCRERGVTVIDLDEVSPEVDGLPRYEE